MIAPANLLLHCCYPILNHLKPFASEDSSLFEDIHYREIFKKDLIAMEKKALAMQVHSTLIQELKYVMVALIDELILHSNWQGKISWLSKPLQLDYFAEHLAGEGFFARLEMLRQNYLDNYEILEIYYICISLGFAGIYRIKGLEFLQALQVGLYQQIEDARHRNNHNNYVTKDTPRQNRKMSIRLSLWTIPVVVSLIIITIYSAYLYAIDKQANNALYQLNKYLELH